MVSAWRHPLRWLGNFWQQIHLEYVDRELKWDYRAVVMLLTAAVSLSCQEFLGDRNTFVQMNFLPVKHPSWEIWYFVWWSGWRVLGFLIVPSIVVMCMPGERLRDYF